MTKEEIKKEIAECEERLKSEQERLANLREELDKTEYGGKRWKPKKNEEYYHVYPNGKIENFFFDSVYDSNVYAQGNCFKTREEAEFEAERRKVIAELANFAEGDEAVWDGNAKHYNLCYSYLYGNVCIDFLRVDRYSELYFSSKEVAEAAIKAVGENRVKKYYLGVKQSIENMEAEE